MNKKVLAISSISAVAIALVGISSVSAEYMGDKHKKHFSPEHREAMQEVLDQNDYNLFVEFVTESERGEKLLEKITEDNFAKFIEMHDLRQEGRVKFEEAKNIADELGLKKPGRRHHKVFRGEES